jgi:hypothetical protein
MKRYWYATKKEQEILKIYYKLMNDDGSLQFYQTQTRRSGNKRVSLVRILMRNNWPIVTKRITLLNPAELNTVEWKEVDEESMLGYLRRGNPDDNARSSLFQFFGRSIFTLTNLEHQYFSKSFPNIDRLVKFYHAIKKECRECETGYTYRTYGGRNVIITPAKIKKAIFELFGEDPQEVLYNNNKKEIKI